MIVLIFGMSNIGKSTTGEILARKLGYHYFDVDDGMTCQNVIREGRNL